MTGKAWNHGGRTRQERGYGAEHVRIRAALMREVVTCEECARKTPPKVTAGTIADHIKPIAKGGKTERSNYQLLCKSCSNRKTAYDSGRTLRRRIGLDGWPCDD